MKAPRSGMTASAALALLALAAAPAALAAAPRAEEPPPVFRPSPDIVPVLRPAEPQGTKGAGRASATVPPALLWRAEGEFRAGRLEEALSLFLDLAYNFPDDERKGYVWMRVGELLLAKGELKAALDAVDRAVPLSKARYLVLAGIDLKLRIYRKMQWRSEARELAAYLLSQRFVDADPAGLHAEIARADAAEGRVARALSGFRQAMEASGHPEAAAALQKERDAFIDGIGGVAALREAGDAEEDPEVRAHLYLAAGRIAVRKEFVGMAAYSLDKAARAGGRWGQEAAQLLYRIEKIVVDRPKIVGLVPLSGPLSEIGHAVLMGAEVALRPPRRRNGENGAPVIRWIDTGGRPDQARREFQAASSDRTVVGFIGPLTGEEGHSVSVAFGSKSPPVLYLGQKSIPDKPFLFGFGLSPAQEARAVLSNIARGGRSDLLLMYPENGYGRGFSDAVAAAAKESGVRVAKTVSYPPELRDFTEVIRKAVGAAAFSRHGRSKEKGKSMKLPFGGIVIADRWDRVFLIASQLRYYNVHLPLAGFSGWNDEELIRKAGDSIAGAVFSVDYADAFPGLQGEQFRKEYREAMGAAPSRFEAAGYDGALFLSEAFALDGGKEHRSAGEAERERIPRLKTFRGATGTFTFGTTGDMRRKVSLLRVELGNFVPVPEP